MMGAVVAGLDSYQGMAKQVLSNEHVREGFAGVLLDIVYEAFQAQSEASATGSSAVASTSTPDKSSQPGA